jgi:hypothetical protein
MNQSLTVGQGLTTERPDSSPRIESNNKKLTSHDFATKPEAPNRASMTPTNAEQNKFKDGFELEKAVLKNNMTKIEENPLAMRIFTHVAQTSTAIQVAWSHPTNF